MEQMYQAIGIVVGLFSLVTGVIYAISRVGVRYVFEDLRSMRTAVSETVKRVDRLESSVESMSENISDMYAQLEYIAGAIRDISEKISMPGHAKQAEYKQAVVRSKKKAS